MSVILSPHGFLELLNVEGAASSSLQVKNKLHALQWYGIY
jgi:hypothetical protein